MSIKALQARRDLLQNLHSQRPNVERDLLAVTTAIVRHSEAIKDLRAEEKSLSERREAINSATAELPALKRELAEAIEAEKLAKAAT